MAYLQDCSKPVAIGGFVKFANNTADSKNLDLETNIEASMFQFAPQSEPESNTGPYGTEEDFIFLKSQTNQHIYVAFKYEFRVVGREVFLEDMFPVQFLYGVGGLRKKSNKYFKREMSSTLF